MSSTLVLERFDRCSEVYFALEELLARDLVKHGGWIAICGNITLHVLVHLIVLVLWHGVLDCILVTSV